MLENRQNLPFDKTIMYCFPQWLKLTFSERKTKCGATAMGGLKIKEKFQKSGTALILAFF